MGFMVATSAGSFNGSEARHWGYEMGHARVVSVDDDEADYGRLFPIITTRLCHPHRNGSALDRGPTWFLHCLTSWVQSVESKE